MSLMATEDRPRAEAPRPALRELLKTRRAELGLSYVKLAQRCIDPETGEQVVKDSWLHRLESGEPVIAPDFRSLVGLAAGLSMSLEFVQAAAGEQFFGIATAKSTSGQARALLARADRMTPEAVDALARFLDVVAPQD